MQFENFNIHYVFSQAQMTFFKLYAYQAYKYENGRLVPDNSDEAKALQAKAEDIYGLLKKASKRIAENKPVPKTWAQAIEEGMALALAAQDLRMTFSVWVEQLYRAIRFLKVYEPSEVAQETA